ncbi:MAG: spore photoproduct lyase, partial [Candidatus Methanoperedens sp.]|nr:spore photoproduct lyase [Candidatus Methanoperedens sp.]
MKLYMPERVFFEPLSLKYPLGKHLFDYFSKTDTEIKQLALNSMSKNIPGKTGREKYVQSKKTLAAVVKKVTALDTCKPSADYEFSLASNCPGSCEYCYLQTTQGQNPYLRVYVNLNDIHDNIQNHIHQNGNRLTVFEAASLGDPLALEHLTGSLAKTVEFFGTLENGRLRTVTKYNNVDSFLNLRHNGHTHFRFSMNSRYVIKSFEHNTSEFDERLDAAVKIAAAGYPTGFIIAPLMIYEGWKEQYLELLEGLKIKMSGIITAEPMTFELIQHRFTPTAKKYILERFPNTKLDMDESQRMLKWG